MEIPLHNENESWRTQVTTPKHLVQAYRQAPWRIETQRGILLLIVTVLGASILWMMVSVTVQASSAGLEIQQLEDQRDELNRKIADQQTEIASLTSASHMAERADALGYQPVQLKDIVYMTVPGYFGRKEVFQTIATKSEVQPRLVKPAYTQSLWEWLQQGILRFNSIPGSFAP